MGNLHHVRFFDVSISLEQIHIFKTSVVAELTVMGKMIGKSKLRTGSGGPLYCCKEWELDIDVVNHQKPQGHMTTVF